MTGSHKSNLYHVFQRTRHGETPHSVFGPLDRITVYRGTSLASMN